MPVNIEGEGSLTWDANLTVEGFINGEKVIERGLENIAEKAVKSSKIFNDAFVQTTLMQTGLANNANESAEAVLNAWKTRAAEIVRLATDAGLKAGESFEFKTNIGGHEKINLISADQLQDMKVMLSLLDDTLTLQDRINQTGLTEFELIERKRQLLLDLNEINSVRINQLQDERVESVIGPEFSKLLQDAGQSYDDLDEKTKKFIVDLTAVSQKLAEVGVAQSALEQAYDDGRIGQKEYTDASIKLAVQLKTLEQDYNNITESQKEYEASLYRVAGSIEEKKAALKSLQVAFEQLDEAELKGAKGLDMAKKISDMKAEINGLDPAKIAQTSGALVTTQTELRRLQELMAHNPGSPMFATWKEEAARLKEALKGVKEEIEQATNNAAGVDAFANGLRGLMGGFTAVTGVMGLFTDDTEEIDRVTKNAASALALLNGVQELSNVLSKTGALNIYLLSLARKRQTADTAAATIATAANTAMAGANTAATTTQAVATTGAATATRSLTAAMLANPAGLLIAGIAALTATYLAFRRTTEETVTRQAALNDSMGEYNKATATAIEVTNKVGNAFDLAKKGLISKKEALQTYNNELGDAFGKTKNLDEAERLFNAKAPDYIRVMGLKSQANALFAKSAAESARALTANTEDQTNFADKISAGFKGLISGSIFSVEGIESIMDSQEKGVERVTKSAQAGAKVLQDEGLKLLTEAEKISKQAGITTFDFDKPEKVKGIQGVNDLLNTRKTLLERIAALQADSRQSGLAAEASELDKINEKYDVAIKKVQDYDAKVEAFNKKNKTKIAVLGADEIAKLEAAREAELQSAEFRKIADDYVKSLEVQREAFEAFEQAKLDFGEQKAKELFAAQTKGSQSYLEYLKKQKSEIDNSINIGPTPGGDLSQILKSQELTKRIEEEEKRVRVEAFNKQIDDYKRLLVAAQSYNDKRAAINKEYSENEAVLLADKSATPEQTQQRLQALKDNKEKALKIVEDQALGETELFKQMNKDILGFTNDRIKEEIKLIDKILATGEITDKQGNIIKLSPEALAQLRGYRKELNEVAEKQRSIFKFTSEEIKALASQTKQVGSSLKGFADAIRPFNEELANSVEDLSNMANTTGQVLDTLAAFASGDIAGVISGTVEIITGIFKTIAKSKEDAKKAQEQVAGFYSKIKSSELEINQLYRERERLQVNINKLKLDGIKDELELLSKQKETNEKDFNSILSELQNEEFVSGETTKKKKKKFGLLGFVGAALGFGATTEVVQQFSSLGGKSFDELEKLFLSGQLTDKAKELFEQLKTIKAEGVDIDAALEQNKRAAQEIFTGTTADSILESVVQGFESGKRATAEFADNFEKIMKQSVLNALKYQALEKPLKKLYEDFAAAAESDGILTAAEISQLQAAYNATITAAGQQFDQLKKITDLNFNNDNTDGNSLQGAIKGITQQQADLLAGQFGGLRMTAFDQLNVARSQLDRLNEIANNTKGTEEMLRYFRVNGIKIQ